ncbi:MAG: hypothetical protein ACR2NZ_07300 [Rubripirellula sp.]
MMRAIGQILLWGGFLGAAFCSVLRLAPPSEMTPEPTAETDQVVSDWATIPWVGYGTSMLFGVAGVVLLRTASKRDHHDDAKTEAEYSVVQSSLASVSSVVQGLCDDESDIDPARILRAIDDQCAEPLSDFADARQSLVKRYGMNTYAEVMTEFASAERFLNRAWSAAADGYVDEVRSSIERSNGHLGNARKLLNEAEQTA